MMKAKRASAATVNSSCKGIVEAVLEKSCWNKPISVKWNMILIKNLYNKRNVCNAVTVA